MKGLLRLFLIFFKIGAFTFGGGYAMLPIMYDEICDKNQLLPQDEMTKIILLSQSLPGVMSVNCATQVGYRLFGKTGAVISTLGVILPSYIVIVLLAELIMTYRENIYVAGAFMAIRAAIVGLILSAAVKMLKNCKESPFQVAIMVMTLVITIVFNINPFFMVLLGGLMGWFMTQKGMVE